MDFKCSGCSRMTKLAIKPPHIPKIPSLASNSILSPAQLKSIIKPKSPKICQHCHSILHQHTLLPNSSSSHNSIHKLLSSLNSTNNIQFMIVFNLLDFYSTSLFISSFISPLQTVGKNLIMVGTRNDLFTPSKSNNLASIQSAFPPKYQKIPFYTTGLSSGFAPLSNHLFKNPHLHTYAIGLYNSGKSHLINSLLSHNSSKAPIITTSPFPGTTFGPIHHSLRNEDSIIKISDTPGVYNPNQLSHHLTHYKDLKTLIPSKPSGPNIITVKGGYSIFIGGLVRFDVHSLEPVSFTFYISNKIPTQVCRTEKASLYYQNNIYTRKLSPPLHSKDKIPPLSFNCEFEDSGFNKTIALQGLGWATISCIDFAKVSVYSIEKQCAVVV